jgi:hypothetical protein
VSVCRAKKDRHKIALPQDLPRAIVCSNDSTCMGSNIHIEDDCLLGCCAV